MARLIIQRIPSSCAVHDIVGVTNLTQAEVDKLTDEFLYPVRAADTFGPAAWDNLGPKMYIFADATERRPGSSYAGHGVKLVRAIKAKKLGTLIETPQFLNGLNGNGVTVWLWHLKQEDIDKRKAEVLAEKKNAERKSELQKRIDNEQNQTKNKTVAARRSRVAAV